MKRFAILRDVPPDLSWEQVDASAIQNLSQMGIPEEERELAWEPRVLGVSSVRSYWQPGSNWATCIYTGPDEETVQAWHELCQVPYVSIREVDVDEQEGVEADYPRGFHEAAPPLLVVEGLVAELESLDESRRIRTYRYPDTGAQLQVFTAPLEERQAPTETGIARRVVEIRPGDYE